MANRVLSSQGSGTGRARGSGSGSSRNNPRKVISGRGLNLGENRNAEVFDFLDFCGWSRYHEDFPNIYYPDLVNEFYQNATFETRDNDPVLRTRVRGRDFELGLTQISFAFNIPDAGEKIYFKIRGIAENLLPGQSMENFYMSIVTTPNVQGQIKNVDMREDRRLLNAYVRANIVPKTGGHSDEVPNFQSFVLHCLATGRQLNLPYIIIKSMEHAKNDTRKSYPYGGFLNKIFMLYGVDVSPDEPTANCEQSISEYIIKQQRVQHRSNRYRGGPNEDPNPGDNVGDNTFNINEDVSCDWFQQ